MINWFFKFLFSLMIVNSLAFSADVLAMVNGDNITTDVAPKNFKTLDKETQLKIVNRLVEKKLAIDYALSTDIVHTKEYKKTLEHVLQMGSSEEKKSENLVNLFKKNSSIDGYTSEQLNSKKGLLAFDFILNKKAKELKPSKQELKEFYESRKYEYDTPHMIELLTIVVDDKKLANEIITKIEKAEDRLEEFSKLAAKYSLAPSAKNYGYFGKIPVDRLNNVLKSSLSGLKKNDLLKSAIKTEFGYQIFYVLNDIPEYNSTFEGVKSTVEDKVLKQKVKKWAIDKIANLKKSASISIKI